MDVSPGQKKSGRNNEVVVRRGSTVHKRRRNFLSLCELEYGS